MSGLIDQLTGNIRISILVFAGLFVIGAILLSGIKIKEVQIFDGMNLDSFNGIHKIHELTDILTSYE